MKNLIHLSDYTLEDVENIFTLADELEKNKIHDVLKGKTVVIFFPPESVHMRLSFEKGVKMLGGHVVNFDSSILTSVGSVQDFVAYLNNWADVIIIRYPDISFLETMSLYSNAPVINAMTDDNHPVEVLSDLYELTKMYPDYITKKFLYVGLDNGVGKAWKEAADFFNLDLIQSAPEAYKLDGIDLEKNLSKAIQDKDVIISSPIRIHEIHDEYQINLPLLQQANDGALFMPVAPFFRGGDVSEDAINSEYFVGHSFKSSLLEVGQAVIIYNLYETYIQQGISYREGLE